MWCRLSPIHNRTLPLLGHIHYTLDHVMLTPNWACPLAVTAATAILVPCHDPHCTTLKLQVIMMPILLSLVVLQVVVMKTCSAVSANKVGIIMNNDSQFSVYIMAIYVTISLAWWKIIWCIMTIFGAISDNCQLSSQNCNQVRYVLIDMCHFVVVCFLWIQEIHLPIFFRFASLSLGQPYDCASASGATPKVMCKNHQHQTTNYSALYIYRGHFSLYNSWKTSHSSPVRARYGVSFMSANLTNVSSL